MNNLLNKFKRGVQIINRNSDIHIDYIIMNDTINYFVTKNHKFICGNSKLLTDKGILGAMDDINKTLINLNNTK